MFVDAQTLMFGTPAYPLKTNGHALTVGTTLSDFAYDTGAQAVAGGSFADFAGGEPLCFAVAVLVAGSTTGAETYEFDIINDSNVNLATTKRILAKFPIAAGDVSAVLTAGTILVLPLPPLNPANVQRFLGLQAILTGAAATITVVAWITSMSMVQTYQAFSTKIVIL